ncbi:MAG: alpha/beta hydrolase [Mobilicoccus sp.]|nr:alpha/beta hydrolase [Mobilicoccus sp.]
MPALRTRLERSLVGLVGRLPAWAVRRLAGEQVVIDGHRLHPLVQLALRGLNADSNTFDYKPVTEGRASLAHEAEVFGAAPEVSIVEDVSLPLQGRTLPARMYRMRPGAAAGMVVYFHGGGWVLGGPEVCDSVCRVIARRTGLVVVAVDYRLAPEHPFPAGVEDAIDSFRWLRDHLADFGIPDGAIVVAGESAGGNLTCVVANATRHDPEGGPAMQVPIFPVTDNSRDHPSMDTLADGYFLTRRQMHWYRDHYFTDDADRLDPRASPLLEPDLAGVAPACVVVAGFDPLRDEGLAYAERLREAGVPTEVMFFEGYIHAFVNATRLGRHVIEPVEAIADRMADGVILRERRATV